MKETNIEEYNNTNQKTSSPATDRPSLTIDVDYYQKFLDDHDISDEQKRELVEVLWSIVTSIVDLGFGLHPVQQCQENDDHAEIAKALVELTTKENQLRKETNPEGVNNEF